MGSTCIKTHLHQHQQQQQVSGVSVDQRNKRVWRDFHPKTYLQQKYLSENHLTRVDEEGKQNHKDFSFPSRKPY